MEQEIIEALKRLEQGAPEFWNLLASELATRYYFRSACVLLIIAVLFVVSRRFFKIAKGKKGKDPEGYYAVSGVTAGIALLMFVPFIDFLSIAISPNYGLLRVLS